MGTLTDRLHSVRVSMRLHLFVQFPVLCFFLLTIIFVSWKGISQTKTFIKTYVSVHGWVFVCALHWLWYMFLNGFGCPGMGYKSMGECTDTNPCVEEWECVCKHTYFICICVVNGCWWRHMGCCVCNWAYEHVFWASVAILLCKFDLLMGGCLYLRVSWMQACSLHACGWVYACMSSSAYFC